MGRISGYMYHGTQQVKKYFVSETNANAGTWVGATSDGGLANPTDVRSRADLYGFSLDTATYSTTPALGATGLIAVDIRADQVANFKMSGGGTEDTALAIVTQTSASATVLTATVQTADIDGGTLWRFQSEGEQAALSDSRQITTHTSTTSLTVLVAFESTMAVGDRFLHCPYAISGLGAGGDDGATNVEYTALFTQADTSIASGTGHVCTVYDLILRSEVDSEVEMMVSVERVFTTGLDPS